MFVDPRVGAGQHAVCFRFRSASDGLSKVMDGVLVSQFLIGSLAFLEVEPRTSGQEAAARITPRKENWVGILGMDTNLEVTG